MTVGDLGLSTIAAWGGEEKPHAYHAAQMPIVQSAPFAYADVAQWRAVLEGREKGDIYSRNTNPTVAVLEEKARLLESGEAAVAFAKSGCSGISMSIGLRCSFLA